ncbi:MAG: hypothetical protein ACE5H4_00020 [Candidatus Thorarchaeota archaeon]
MGILGTQADVIFDVNLIIQTLLIAVLLVGYYSMKPRRLLKRHGVIMATGTIINLAAVLSIMLPSLILNWNAVASDPTHPGVLITIVHVAFGTIAILVASRFSLRFLRSMQRNTPLMCGTRRSMYTTLASWLISMGLGYGFYIFYYL